MLNSINTEKSVEVDTFINNPRFNNIKRERFNSIEECIKEKLEDISEGEVDINDTVVRLPKFSDPIDTELFINKPLPSEISLPIPCNNDNYNLVY